APTRRAGSRLVQRDSIIVPGSHSAICGHAITITIPTIGSSTYGVEPRTISHIGACVTALIVNRFMPTGGVIYAACMRGLDTGDRRVDDAGLQRLVHLGAGHCGRRCALRRVKAFALDARLVNYGDVPPELRALAAEF